MSLLDSDISPLPLPAAIWDCVGGVGSRKTEWFKGSATLYEPNCAPSDDAEKDEADETDGANELGTGDVTVVVDGPLSGLFAPVECRKTKSPVPASAVTSPAIAVIHAGPSSPMRAQLLFDGFPSSLLWLIWRPLPDSATGSNQAPAALLDARAKTDKNH
jgi:hypothetical protein